MKKKHAAVFKQFSASFEAIAIPDVPPPIHPFGIMTGRVHHNSEDTSLRAIAEAYANPRMHITEARYAAMCSVVYAAVAFLRRTKTTSAMFRPMQDALTELTRITVKEELDG